MTGDTPFPRLRALVTGCAARPPGLYDPVPRFARPAPPAGHLPPKTLDAGSLGTRDAPGTGGGRSLLARRRRMRGPGTDALLHDPAAVITGGRVVSAAQKKWFSRLRHGERPARIAAVAHADGTALIRADGTGHIRTVRRSEGLAPLVTAGFERRTGLPAVVDTSLATAARPVAHAPRDALERVSPLVPGPSTIRRGRGFA